MSTTAPPAFAVGLDLSLTASGVAEVYPNGDVAHRTLGSLADNGTIQGRSARLRGLAGMIHRHVIGATLVAVEQPSYGSTGGKGHDRSGLWWLVVARLTGAGIPVVEVAPGTLKVYATGKGNGSKDAVLSAVVRRWGALCPDLDNNNEADAVVLASLAAARLGWPPVELPQDHTRALKAVKWPEHLQEEPRG